MRYLSISKLGPQVIKYDNTYYHKSVIYTEAMSCWPVGHLWLKLNQANKTYPKNKIKILSYRQFRSWIFLLVGHAVRLVRILMGSCPHFLDAKGLVVGTIAYRQAQTRYFNLVIFYLTCKDIYVFKYLLDHLKINRLWINFYPLNSVTQ